MHIAQMMGLAVFGITHPAAQQPVPLFRQVFPNPTGRNGYEEIVLAADLAIACKPLAAALAPKATLATKRQVMGNRDAIRALTLLRQGMNKPTMRPEPIPMESSLELVSNARRLGSLVKVAVYTQLAEGRVAEAIDTHADGLKLSYVLHSDNYIGGLVGIAVNSVLINNLIEHRGQFSLHDCDKLLNLVRERLSAPDPAIACIRTERRSMEARLREQLTAGPVRPEQLLEIFDRYLADLFEALKAPHHKRVMPSIPEFPSALEQYKLVIPFYVFSDVSLAFAKDLARWHLLAVHAAIRRHQWENDALPDSLSVLGLGNLIVDPVTGDEFTFRRLDTVHYELVAEGLKLK